MVWGLGDLGSEGVSWICRYVSRLTMRCAVQERPFVSVQRFGSSGCAQGSPGTNTTSAVHGSQSRTPSSEKMAEWKDLVFPSFIPRSGNNFSYYRG